MTCARRAWVGIVVAASAATADVPAAHADVKETCATAYEQAQRLYRESRFDLARGQLAICTQTCPDSLVKDCERWSRQVGEAMATVILEARDKSGKPLSESRVSIDGRPLADRLDGKPVAVDPGSHVFRFELPSGEAKEQRATFARGAKEQRVVVTFDVEAPSPPAAPTVAPPPTSTAPSSPADSVSPRGPPATFYVLGVLGIVGVGIGAGLGIKGHVDKANLQSCAPTCDQAEVDAIRTEWIIAGIAGGVGVIAVGAAIVVLASSPSASSGAGVGGRATTWIGVRPTRAGLGASLGGSF